MVCLCAVSAVSCVHACVPCRLSAACVLVWRVDCQLRACVPCRLSAACLCAVSAVGCVCLCAVSAVSCVCLCDMSAVSCVLVCRVGCQLRACVPCRLSAACLCAVSAVSCVLVWRVGCQLEKKKTNTDIPMLLPKSNSSVSVPRWVSSAAFCCSTQVCYVLMNLCHCTRTTVCDISSHFFLICMWITEHHCASCSLTWQIWKSVPVNVMTSTLL